jgi:hypothetical protein
VNGPSGDWPEELGDLVSGGGGSGTGNDPPEVKADDVFTLEVVTTSGRAANVRFVFRPRLVEVWYRRHLGAVIDREVLRAWLAAPQAPLVVDEVALSLDRMVDSHGRVALSLPDVMVWTLAPEDLAGLRARV